eukprot:scaffold364242_cov162-Cyclotella_meneghiniana.AAC.1
MNTLPHAINKLCGHANITMTLAPIIISTPHPPYRNLSISHFGHQQSWSLPSVFNGFPVNHLTHAQTSIDVSTSHTVTFIGANI